MNCYSFIGHEYSFFNAIVSRLIALNILKSQNYLDLLAAEYPPGVLQSQSLCNHFFPYKTQSSSKTEHRLKCLDKSLN